MILSVRLSVALWYNFNKGRPTVYIGSCSTSKTLVVGDVNMLQKFEGYHSQSDNFLQVPSFWKTESLF